MRGRARRTERRLRTERTVRATRLAALALLLFAAPPGPATAATEQTVPAAVVEASPPAAEATETTVPGGTRTPERDGDPIATPAFADGAALERVLAESDVATRRGPPGLWAYVGTLVRRLLAWVGGGLESAAAAVALAPLLVRILAWAVAAAAAAAVVAAVVALVRRRLRRPGARGEPPPPPAAPAGSRARGAGEWRAEIERSLAGGRIAEALAAVWEWLAGALCGAGAEPSWTGGELLAPARRPDLAPAVARLDAMTYGPRRPLPAEVRELVGGLDRGLDVRPGGTPSGVGVSP